MNPYLDQDDYLDAYYDAQKNMRKFFEPFDEFERIMANKLRDDLPDNMPQVNDGSLAALLLETPMRVLAQMMTGSVKVLCAYDPKAKGYKEVDAQPWLAELANSFWTHRMIPNMNTQAPWFTKWQVALYKALGYGAQPIFDFYTVRGNYKGSDISLPYVRDVYLEPGKVSDQDSNYIILDSHYTKADLRDLINQAKQAAADGVDSSWDAAALQQIYNDAEKNEKDTRNKNKQERDRGIETAYIKFTTIFQRGINSPFDTFHAGGNDNAMTIVRSKKNDDPTGDIPIHYLYAYEDLTNPLGKGQVEISGGTQNVLDYLIQADVLATMIGVQPPIHVKGDRSSTDLNSLIYAPRQLWLEGNADVSTEQTASQVYGQFPNRYGLYKTTMLNAQGTTTADVSSEAGAPNFSKTPAGITAQQARTNAHDNFLRQSVNATYERVAKRCLNVTFNLMQGVDVLKLAEDDATRLAMLGLIELDPQTGKPATNQVAMTWKNLRGHYEFEVDPESSIIKDDATNVAKGMEVLQVLGQNPELIAAIQQSHDFDVGELATGLITRLGLPDLEKIIKPKQQDTQGGTVDPNTGQPMPGGPPQAAQPAQPAAKPPSESITFKDAVAAGATDAAADMLDQAGLSSNDLRGKSPSGGAPAGTVPPHILQAVQDTMQKYGVDQPAALAILHAQAIGVPEQMIIDYIRNNPDKAGTPAPAAPAPAPVQATPAAVGG